MASTERQGGTPRGETDGFAPPPIDVLSWVLTLDEQMHLLQRDPALQHPLRGRDSVLLAGAGLLETARADALHVVDRQLEATPGYRVPRPHLAATAARVAAGSRRDNRPRRLLLSSSRRPQLWPEVDDSLQRHGIPRCAGSLTGPGSPAHIARWSAAASLELRAHLTPLVMGYSPPTPPRLVLLAGLVCLTGLVDHLVPRAPRYGAVHTTVHASRLLTSLIAGEDITVPAHIAQTKIVNEILSYHEFHPDTHMLG